ncbi:MAG: glycosyltransferase family 4 protein [Geobacter sp.]|nr:glycosyltransferase family 4 protein [Geobacter sp.]
MKIALITPYYYPAVRGNAVTVRRIEKCLVNIGVQVAALALDVRTAEEIARIVAEERPDVIHAFHGWAGGRVARVISAQTGIPYIVTLTGTDVYEALEDGRKTETHEALRDARKLAVFHDSVKKRLTEHFPTLAEKTVVIPQGVEIPGVDCSGIGGFPFSPGKLTFLLPAGLRPVKNVLFALEPLARLFEQEPRGRFVIAGPIIDPDYAAEVMVQLERYPFAHYIGGIGHDAIGCLYNKADVILNTSLSEGGMANSVLEGMAFGKPVLAAAIEANRWLIKDGMTGFLYHDAKEFLEKAAQLIADDELRKRLGEHARGHVLENFAPEKEAAAYAKLYETVTGKSRVSGES